MNRNRTESPVYSRQWSGASSSTVSSSPVGSPAHPRARLPPSMGMSTIKRKQNVAPKAAVQRLATVMAFKAPNEEDVDDDLDFWFGPPAATLSISSSNVNSNSGGGLVWILVH